MSSNVVNFGGIINMSQCIKYVEYIDLNGNRDSPWNGYCAIIKHCYVSKLTLFGVKGIKKYAKELTKNLHTNTMLQSLTVCASYCKMSNYKFMALKANNTKGLQNNVTVNERILFSTLTGDNEDITRKGVVNGKVNDGNNNTDGECLPEIISLSESNVDDDILCLITFGLYNNTTVKILDLSCNNITYEGAVILSDSLKHNNTLQKLDLAHNNLANNGTIAIGECLKHNNTLKEINLSQNDIESRGMNNLDKCIKYTKSLQCVDLSGNQSSPWGVYCAILRHCGVNSLILYGDKGIKEFTKVITDSLQTNATLQSLTLYKIGKSGLQSIKDVIHSNITLKELNLSWMNKRKKIIVHRNIVCNKIKGTSYRSVSTNFKEVLGINILYDGDHECSSEVIDMSNKYINDDAVYLISFGLSNNTSVQKLDLSCNCITDHGVVGISRYLKCNNRLKELNLSQNCISDKGMDVLSKCIKNTKQLTHLDLSGNDAPPGVYIVLSFDAVIVIV